MRGSILSAALLTAMTASHALAAPAAAGENEPAPPTGVIPARAEKPANRPAKPAPAKPAAAALPTEAEIRAAFDAGDYAKALQQLQRVIVLKGAAAAAYNRYDMLMLKGESHLRSKQYKSAADAFGLAAKASEDEVQQATARATQRLVLEAKGPTVQRRSLARGEKPEKADLLDPEQREQALRIVHADLRAANEPKVKAARRAHTLPPIVEALELVSVTRDFELAGVVEGGTAGDTDTAARDELAERARELIEKEVGAMEGEVAEIHERAQIVTSQKYVQTESLMDRRNGGRRTGAAGARYEGESTTTTMTEYRRGVTPEEKKQLNQMIQTCRKIIPTTESLARATGLKQSEADAVIERTKKVRRAAERVLGTKY
jgi:hypothetical protein